MRTKESLITFAALSAAIAVGLASPAAAAPTVNIKPGPVRVVFGQPADDEPRAGDASQLFVYGVTPFTTLTSQGPIVWRGHVSKAGRLRFPLAKQTWPDHALLPKMSIVRLTGRVRPSGKVTLTGTFKGRVTAVYADPCKVTSPIALSTRIVIGLGLPNGSDYDAKTGSIALMSKALNLTKTGSDAGCGMVPTSALVFLTGHMKLPGGVPIPKQ